MKLESALEHFKCSKKQLADICGVVPSAITKWNPIIPLDRAALLERRSYGALKIDWGCYDETGKPRKDAA
jgi:hypothetical protein